MACKSGRPTRTSDRVGSHFAWFPLQGVTAPPALELGDWLAGARHLHFAFAWLLVGNGVAYVLYCARSGEWRRRLFQPRRDARNALETAAGYARLRPAPARPGELYNGLQRVAYTSAIALGALLVLSGLAIWKPVQLGLLGAAFGGYDGARAVHLLALVALTAFTLGHVVMVALHPRTLLTMFQGGRRG